jgi:dTDP-4-dehydrorhamnose reductase
MMIFVLIQGTGIRGASLILIFMNKILVLGSTGMLGRMVSEYFSQFPEYELFQTFRSIQNNKLVNNHKFDAMTDSLELLIEKIKPDYLINCIGIIKPEINERNQSSINRAININTYFPIKLSKSAKKHNFKYVQIGTDCVFSGLVGNYQETSFQDAADVYGKTKIAGEIFDSSKYLLRSSIVGPEPGQGKSLLNWFLSQNQQTVNGFIDHKWNGITTLNFAKIVHGMIKSSKFINNLQHITPQDEVSKYELLLYFNKYFHANVTIESVDSNNPVNRTLATINPELNQQLWNMAGYRSVPTIEENIKELAESNVTKSILNSI